jgi:plasmid stabilization system protein ParE
VAREPFAVFFTRAAARDFEVAAAWWRTNRPAAPLRFEEEVAGALRLLATAPSMGAPSIDTRLRGVRRCFLSATRYWIYYRARDESQALDVLRIWHASRGRAPKT